MDDMRRPLLFPRLKSSKREKNMDILLFNFIANKGAPLLVCTEIK